MDLKVYMLCKCSIVYQETLAYFESRNLVAENFFSTWRYFMNQLANRLQPHCISSSSSANIPAYRPQAWLDNLALIHKRYSYGYFSKKSR